MLFRESVFVKATKQNRYYIDIAEGDDKIEAWNLVHDVFLDSEYIVQCPANIRFRQNYEGSPALNTLAAMDKKGKIVGTIGFIELLQPMMWQHPYRDELEYHFLYGKVIYEATNLAVYQSAREIFIFLELTRALFACMSNKRPDYLFIEISEKHLKFFQGILKFKKEGERRIINATTMDSTVGMMVDVKKLCSGELYRDCPDMEQFYLWENPYISKAKEWLK